MKNLRIIVLFLSLSCFKDLKNLHFKNKNINEELLLAFKENDLNRIINLIERGANIEYTYHDKTILEMAIENFNLDIIKNIFERISFLNNKYTKGKLLLYASALGREEIVEFLIEKGADVNIEGYMEIHL